MRLRPTETRLLSWRPITPSPDAPDTLRGLFEVEFDASSDGLIRPGETAEIEIHPQIIFKLKKVMIPDGVAECFDVSITSRSADPSLVLASALVHDAKKPDNVYRAIDPIVKLIVIVQNKTDRARWFLAYLVGRGAM
jgi:hypothetical protein